MKLKLFFVILFFYACVDDDQIFIENFGGEGGELWRPRIDGQQQGPFGDNGEVTILDWEK